MILQHLPIAKGANLVRIHSDPTIDGENKACHMY